MRRKSSPQSKRRSYDSLFYHCQWTCPSLTIHLLSKLPHLRIHNNHGWDISVIQRLAARHKRSLHPRQSSPKRSWSSLGCFSKSCSRCRLFFSIYLSRNRENIPDDTAMKDERYMRRQKTSRKSSCSLLGGRQRNNKKIRRAAAAAPSTSDPINSLCLSVLSP
jgi:hypothetical protein